VTAKHKLVKFQEMSLSKDYAGKDFKKRKGLIQQWITPGEMSTIGRGSQLDDGEELDDEEELDDNDAPE